MAPVLYGWIKLMTKIFPVVNLRTTVLRTVLEQLTYGPGTTAIFFFMVSLMEKKTIEESKQEVREKFWPTYQVSDVLPPRC